MTTIRDVAKRCGLSAMTVSAVLNNRPGAAGQDTRDRVLRVVEEMGYQPNAVARSFRRQRMNTLGVVLNYNEDDEVPLTFDRYLSPVLAGIFKAAKHHGQRTLIITESSWEDAQRNLLSYTDGQCDGLIFILPLMPSAGFLPLQKRSTPFVIIGESQPEEALPVIDLDNVQAALKATGFLISKGHRRIAFFRGDDVLHSADQREAGYRQALTANQLSVEPGLIFSGGYQIESGYQRMRFLLSRPRELWPTAVFCADDYIALGAWKALKEQGLSVPDEMSLIGINDDPEGSAVEPGLTTIRQPLRHYGQQAVEMVIGQIAQKMSSSEKLLVSGEIIVRGSVGPPHHVS